MDITAQLQAMAQQQGAEVKGDGSDRRLRATRAGQLFTADWKTELILGGYGFNVTVGTPLSATDITLIVGGGNGTTIVGAEPEMAIGTPVGYYHIPLGFTAAVQGDSNADANVANIVLATDQTQIIVEPIAASSAIEVPQNLLDGGPASVSRAQSAVTTAITTPVPTMLLAFATNRHSQVAADGTLIQTLRLDYDPSYPVILKGPCSVFACWGGTVAQSGMASYNWAEVPIKRFE